MFCIQCGAQNTELTRYCNRCGANLETLRLALASGALEKASPVCPSKLILVLSTIIACAGFGTVFGTIAGIATTQTQLHSNDLPPLLICLALFGMLGTFLIVGRLLRLINPKPAKRVELPKSLFQPARELREGPVATLAPGVLEGASSVIEHTTHRLGDHAAIKR